MSLDAVQANISLHHLEVKSREPQRLAEFYSNVMDMKLTRLNNQKFLCEGPGRKIIMSTGKNKTFGVNQKIFLSTSSNPDTETDLESSFSLPRGTSENY